MSRFEPIDLGAIDQLLSQSIDIIDALIAELPKSPDSPTNTHMSADCAHPGDCAWFHYDLNRRLLPATFPKTTRMYSVDYAVHYLRNICGRLQLICVTLPAIVDTFDAVLVGECSLFGETSSADLRASIRASRRSFAGAQRAPAGLHALRAPMHGLHGAVRMRHRRVHQHSRPGEPVAVGCDRPVHSSVRLHSGHGVSS